MTINPYFLRRTWLTHKSVPRKDAIMKKLYHKDSNRRTKCDYMLFPSKFISTLKIVRFESAINRLRLVQVVPIGVYRKKPIKIAGKKSMYFIHSEHNTCFCICLTNMKAIKWWHIYSPYMQDKSCQHSTSLLFWHEIYSLMYPSPKDGA